MFRALLVHHQGVHNCIKQSSNPLSFPVCEIVAISPAYEYKDGYVQSN